MGLSDWTELPKNLLDLVLQRLQLPSDYVRFSAVCMSWNSVAKDNLRRHTRLTGPPMLLTYTGKEETWNLCDMRNQKVLDFQLKLPNTRFCGFSMGWLITIDENFIVTLIEPFSKVTGRGERKNSVVSLPRLNPPGINEGIRTVLWDKIYDFFVFKAIISTDPISNANGCIIVVIYEDSTRLAFIRLDKDTKWTYIDSNICNITDVVYIEDKLYAVDVTNRLFSFDITTSQFNFTLVAEGFNRPGGFFKTYLVESSNHKELLMVHRYMRYLRRRHQPRLTKKFKVFKFDADNHKWAEINTLGDVSLFVGDSVVSVMASNFIGCLPNCIYFIHDWDRSIHRRRHRDYGVYDMTYQDIYNFEDASTPIKMSNRTPMWTMAKIKL